MRRAWFSMIGNHGYHIDCTETIKMSKVYDKFILFFLWVNKFNSKLIFKSNKIVLFLRVSLFSFEREAACRGGYSKLRTGCKDTLLHLRGSDRSKGDLF